MHIRDLFESDEDHAKALARTGFWGARGSGCVFLAKDTKRFLLAHRSRSVEQPDTWGTWGGAIDSHENPETAALREAEEESGYSGQIKMLPLYVFNALRGGKVVFQYHNFLAIIPVEFTPRLNWETQGFQWCEFGHWPQPLHFGTVAMFKDGASIKTIRKAVTS
jgi:8-oxo-dGTP pyrophosphatase MutT (NUDIX family)